MNVYAIKGYITRQMDFLSQNDTYMIMCFREQKLTTAVKQNVFNPDWSKQNIFLSCTEDKNNKKDNVLKLYLKDQDIVKDDNIGCGEIDLQPYFRKGRSQQVYVRIKSGSIPAGKVLLHLIPFNSRQQPVSNPNLWLQDNPMKFYNPNQHHRYEIDLQTNRTPISNIGKYQSNNVTTQSKFGVNSSPNQLKNNSLNTTDHKMMGNQSIIYDRPSTSQQQEFYTGYQINNRTLPNFYKQQPRTISSNYQSHLQVHPYEVRNKSQSKVMRKALNQSQLQPQIKNQQVRSQIWITKPLNHIQQPTPNPYISSTPYTSTPYALYPSYAPYPPAPYSLIKSSYSNLSQKNFQKVVASSPILQIQAPSRSPITSTTTFANNGPYYVVQGHAGEGQRVDYHAAYHANNVLVR